MTQQPKRAGRREDRGIALVAVLLVMLLMLGIAAAFHGTVINETSARGSNLRAAQGFYASEAGINRGMGDYRNIFLNYNIPQGADFNPHTFPFNGRTVTYQLTNLPGNPFTVVVPAGRLFAGVNADEYRYTADSFSQLNMGDVEADVGTQFNVDYIPMFQFLAFYARDLEVEPGPTALFHGFVHTNGSLYLNSGATMTIADCKAGAGPGQCNPNAIPIVNVSAAGNVYRGRKDTSSCGGTVQISKLTDADNNGVLDLQTLNCSGAGTTLESSATLATWLGSILARQPVVAVPQPSALNRLGTYWSSANLRIVLDTTTPDAKGLLPIVVQDANGGLNPALTAQLQNFMNARPGRIFYNDVPTPANRGASTCALPAAGTYCHFASYQWPFPNNGLVYACPRSDPAPGGPGLYGAGSGCANYVSPEALSTGGNTYRRGGFYNNREHAWVYMLNVNVHDLLAWNRAQGGVFFPANVNNQGGAVIFLSVVGPGSNGVQDPRYGVRVFGTPNLDFQAVGVGGNPTGLTVISDHAIYVEGDYNTGAGGCTFGNGACPWMPAAFFGDTINVLSNNWSNGLAACRNDCQSFQTLASRPATSTTMNAAFLGGVDDTTAGNYNGGLENYPRFHEDWSPAVPGQQTLNYRGSFVSLGVPQHSNGPWCNTGMPCNIYNPPIRNWDYDTNFNNAANLPPMTPAFVTVQQILFTENFR